MKYAAAILAAAIGLALSTAATADPPRPDTLTPDAFADRYRCESVTPHQWSEATPLLTRRHAVKTSVYAGQGDTTWLVRRGTNKATVAAIASQGDLRLVCRDLVPFGSRVAWS